LTLFTYPIFTAILGAIFFSTPLTKRIVIVLITTYLGLWTMFNQESSNYTNPPQVGVSETKRMVITLISHKLLYVKARKL
jgi:drug/metabolite transporter (DMT)-like permease